MSAPEKTLLELLRSGDAAGALARLAAFPHEAAARDAQGVSPLMWSLYVRATEVTAAIRARLPELDLFEAVAVGDEARAEALLAAQPALVLARSGDGFTALHLAAFFARPALARRLLAAGADPAAVAANAMRVQPLHSAAAARDLETCRVLLEAGAPPDAAQHQGWTTLMSAGRHGWDALAELLLAHGASREPKADDGRTAADLAREAGHTALAAKLSTGGA